MDFAHQTNRILTGSTFLSLIDLDENEIKDFNHNSRFIHSLAMVLNFPFKISPKMMKYVLQGIWTESYQSSILALTRIAKLEGNYFLPFL